MAGPRRLSWPEAAWNVDVRDLDLGCLQRSGQPSRAEMGCLVGLVKGKWNLLIGGTTKLSVCGVTALRIAGAYESSASGGTLLEEDFSH